MSNQPVKKTWPLEAEREFWRSACTPGTSPDSLWWFVRIAWGAEWYFRKTGKSRWLSPRVHKPFLRWLSGHIMEWKAWVKAGRVERKLLLVILPRDVGKTVLGTKCATVWAQLDDPDMTAYIGSETHPKARGFLTAIKGVLEGDDDHAWFSWLYGNWRHKTRAWNDSFLKHAYRRAMSISEPSIGTFGLDMGITGEHPMWENLDDPTSQETLTEQTLEKGRDTYDSTKDYALSKSGFFLGNMTRYALNDVPGYIMNSEGIATWSGIPNPEPRSVPPIGEGKVHVYFLQGRDTSNKTEQYPKGTPVFPEVYSDEDLTERELRDPVNYANQIQNTPSIGEHMPLEYAQIERMFISRDDLEHIPIDYATLHLDTAFKVEDRIAKGDYNVCLGVLHSMRGDGRVFIDKIIRNKTDRSEQFIPRICGYLMSLRGRGIRVKVITDEMEGGGKAGTFKQLLQVSLSMAGFHVGPDSILLFNRTARKPERLRKAAAYWAEGYVRIVKGIEFADRLMVEMVNLEKADHDDIADAASDIWQPGVWSRPHRPSPNVGEAPLQPGDEVLRPALVRVDQLYGSDRQRRLHDELERYHRDDPV